MSSELAVKNGIRRQTYYTRKARGWTEEEAANKKTIPPKIPFTDEELAYMCMFYESDGPTLIAAALDRHMQSVSRRYRQLKRNGMVDHYKQLWEGIG